MDIWILIRHNSVTRNSHIVNCFTTEEKARFARELAIKCEVEKYGSLGSNGESDIDSVAYVIERSFVVS